MTSTARSHGHDFGGDPRAIASAPASRRSCIATLAVANRYRRALPAMAGCRVGDAVRVQACGRFRPPRIIRETAVTPRIVSLVAGALPSFAPVYPQHGCPTAETSPNAPLFPKCYTMVTEISMIYPALALFQWLRRLALILGKPDRTSSKPWGGG